MTQLAIKFLSIAAVAYVAALLILAIGQRYFIYPAPKGEGRDVPGFEEILYRTSDGLDLKAGYRAAVNGMPTIVYFHGNGADWQSSVVATDRLTPAGYGVLAAEYRGYRGNPGSPSEEGLYADGRAAIAWLSARGVANGDIVLIKGHFKQQRGILRARWCLFRHLPVLRRSRARSCGGCPRVCWCVINTIILPRSRASPLRSCSCMETPMT